MTNETATNDLGPDTLAPATLTDDQAALVSGGAAVASLVFRGGCPYCTSGLPVAFMNMAAVVNPAPLALMA